MSLSINLKQVSRNVKSTMVGVAASAFVISNTISLAETGSHAANTYTGNSGAISYEGLGLKTAVVVLSTIDGFARGVSTHATGTQDCLEYDARRALPEWGQAVHSVIGLPGATLAGTLAGLHNGIATVTSTKTRPGICGGPPLI